MTSGKDLSFRYILLPAIKELLEGCNLKMVLDIGCGIGQLTRELATVSDRVVAVDPSPRSIALAQESCSALPNTSFSVCEIEAYASERPCREFSAAVASMTLMDCLDLDSFVEAVATMIVPGGCLIASITHPWFWPLYREYADSDWFEYSEEILLESPFVISEETTDCITTHVHRPLTSYLRSLSRAGFVVDRLLEPFPDEKVQALYSRRWKFPRFLVLRALMT